MVTSTLSQTPEQRSPSLVRECACFRIRSAARAVTGLYDKVLEPSGLRVTQLAMVSTLAFRGPIAMRQLAALLGLDSSTLTRTLKPLRELGIVELVAPGAGDRRQRQVALTDLGRARALEAYGLWIDAQRRLRERLGSERFERLLGDLAEAARVLGEPAD